MAGRMGETEPIGEDHGKKPWARISVGLLGLSVAFWILLPAVPFLPLGTAEKAALGGGLIVAAEVAFWIGAMLAGPEAARRMRSWLRVRRRERDDSS